MVSKPGSFVIAVQLLPDKSLDSSTTNLQLPEMAAAHTGSAMADWDESLSHL